MIQKPCRKWGAENGSETESQRIEGRIGSDQANIWIFNNNQSINKCVYGLSFYFYG